METRQVTETKIYKLVLNPMRDNTEQGSLVAISFDKQKLIEWHNRQLATEPYTDNGSPSFECHGDSHNWHKSFIKGGELEWFNPCDNFNEPNHWGHGISEEWVQEGAEFRQSLRIIQ
jgi:hypothetical protein